MTARMTVLRNIGLLATCRAAGGQSDLHLVPRAAIAWEGDTIRWVGPESALPPELARGESLDAGGRLVVPGLVDCHTHLAFGGWRADEFERRLQGATYLDIAREGGGIMSTVRATRAASDADLLRRASDALEGMRRLGVTTVECKSGYGLELDTELRLLRTYRALETAQPSRLVPTFLGAHVVPAEHRADRAVYIRMLLEQMIPAVAAEGLARVLRRVRGGHGVHAWRRRAASSWPGARRGSPPSCTPTSSPRAEAPSSRPRWGR